MTTRYSALSLSLLLLLGISSSTTHARFTLPKSIKGKLATASVLAGTLYTAWLRMQPLRTKDELKPINSWQDYFLEAQIKTKDPHVFNMTMKSNGGYQAKALKYPAHGAGKIITFSEEFAKYVIPYLIIALTLHEFGDKKALGTLKTLGLWKDGQNQIVA